LGRTVAIKVLPPNLAADPDRRRRFEQEARAVSALNHPHIYALHDVGSRDGAGYLVMEYVEGQTLADRPTKGPIAIAQALEDATQVVDALAKAHRQGISPGRSREGAGRSLRQGGVCAFDSAGWLS
jgi:serine/threonine protein kinase